MVNVGRREDGLIDWANGKQDRINAVLEQINAVLEQIGEWEGKALTMKEIEIISIVKGLLTL
jgi:hypothetical protein